MNIDCTNTKDGTEIKCNCGCDTFYIRLVVSMMKHRAACMIIHENTYELHCANCHVIKDIYESEIMCIMETNKLNINIDNSKNTAIVVNEA